VPQLNLYVPNDVAARLKREARRAGLPLSRYVVSLIVAPRESAWPAGYFSKTCGFLREDFPEPEDPAPEPVEITDPRP